ncbi:MAG: GDYXXLXY domain-containing protein [Hyphomicrobium sp.]|nr:GDYXXLXY domain-containing protein [Hyphomicrobium sp.]
MMSERRNLWLAVAVVALGQAAVLGWMIWDRTSLLANGREVVLEVIPVDPRSLFRGDYVILGYDISRFKLPPGATPPKRNEPFYVTLRKSEGDNWQAVAGASEPPAEVKPDEVVIKGRVEYVARPAPDQPQEPMVVGLHYGIESFFVPEGTGRELEKMVGDKKISALIAVDDGGTAAIKGLMSEGKRVYEEPLL